MPYETLMELPDELIVYVSVSLCLSLDFVFVVDLFVGGDLGLRHSTRVGGCYRSCDGPQSAEQYDSAMIKRSGRAMIA
jgi:hypothetical protein